MKLDKGTLRCAIKHIVEKGDTDIFPYPFEIRFLAERIDPVVDSLSQLDISNYHPLSLIESLVPKTRFGFRVAHQPFPIDTVIYTALVLKIFDSVEFGRDPVENNRAFSYRKSPGLDSDLFVPSHSFRDWMAMLNNYAFETKYSHAIRTDISDFYLRIYRHRLENILDSLSGDTVLAKKIEKFIADWRGGQSFGIPVGTNASRLLAEAALNDTDLALISEGYEHTRYVDDMVIFIKRGQDPYAALGYLARHLSANEGLSLNNQKTKVQTWSEFLASIDDSSAEDDANRDELATEKLFWAAYGNDLIEPKALEALAMKDLTAELEALIAEDYWNMGAIRIVLHAMRLVKNAEVATYIRSNLAELVPFAKDICLLIEEFTREGVKGFENISDEITRLLLSERMRPLDCARAWLLELGVRKIVSFSASQIRNLDALTTTLDLRQLHLIRWRAGDVNYFRSRKARVNEIHAWAQPSFIFGASCLPRDEYSHWIRSIKSRLQFPLGKEFADWCMDRHGTDPLHQA